MDANGTVLRWNVRKRLERIELLLMWDGRVNRADLTDFFGISDPQASADLTLYRKLASRNVVYDPSAKTYVASEQFEPVLVEPDTGRYFSQLNLIATGIMDPSQAWFRNLPEFEALDSPRGQVKPAVLRSMLSAMRGRHSVHVHYQSMTRPKPTWRWVSPHALAFDGRRWHVRCFCHIRNEFRDFGLARILDLGEHEDSPIDPKTDTSWTTFIKVNVEPHPGLNPTQQKVVALDYGMKRGQLKLKVRKAMLFYLIHHHKLHPEKYQLAPHEQQIVLGNPNEVMPHLVEAVSGKDIKRVAL